MSGNNGNGEREFELFFDGIFYKVGRDGLTKNVPRIVHARVKAPTRLLAEFVGQRMEGKIVGFNERARKLLGAWETKAQAIA